MHSIGNDPETKQIHILRIALQQLVKNDLGRAALLPVKATVGQVQQRVMLVRMLRVHGGLDVCQQIHRMRLVRLSLGRSIHHLEVRNRFAHLLDSLVLRLLPFRVRLLPLLLCGHVLSWLNLLHEVLDHLGFVLRILEALKILEFDNCRNRRAVKERHPRQHGGKVVGRIAVLGIVLEAVPVHVPGLRDVALPPIGVSQDVGKVHIARIAVEDVHPQRQQPLHVPRGFHLAIEGGHHLGGQVVVFVERLAELNLRPVVKLTLEQLVGVLQDFNHCGIRRRVGNVQVVKQAAHVQKN